MAGAVCSPTASASPATSAILKCRGPCSRPSASVWRAPWEEAPGSRGQQMKGLGGPRLRLAGSQGGGLTWTSRAKKEEVEAVGWALGVPECWRQQLGLADTSWPHFCLHGGQGQGQVGVRG